EAALDYSRQRKQFADGDFVSHRITVAWVLMPSLVVVPAEQVYTSLGPGRVRFASGTYTADIDLDGEGYVLRYPGLAERIDPR
ncbi:putative glycolipid-binding domain-containing protein, partial [Micromonospora azadirachtae]